MKNYGAIAIICTLLMCASAISIAFILKPEPEYRYEYHYISSVGGGVLRFDKETGKLNRIGISDSAN